MSRLRMAPFSAGWQYPGSLGPRLEEPLVWYGDHQVRSGRTMGTAEASVPTSGAPQANSTAAREANV